MQMVLTRPRTRPSLSCQEGLRLEAEVPRSRRPAPYRGGLHLRSPAGALDVELGVALGLQASLALLLLEVS
jgi:hypothetical protein